MNILIPNKSDDIIPHDAGIISGRCPECGCIVVFERIVGRAQNSGQPFIDLCVKLSNTNIYLHLGHRYCPKCRCHIFFIKKEDFIITYPSERIDFDKTKIPQNIIKVFEEAITCHSNKCYTSSAIMIRRTFEEICRDKNAKGKDLKTRIEALGKIIIIPPELFEGMDNLRLLGNDAAHVDAKDYDEIGENEVKLGIDITKEILKAIYQYTDLVERLKKLKKTEGTD
jgi:hypothetical protein